MKLSSFLKILFIIKLKVILSYAQNGAVTQITIVDQTTTSINLSWVNPTNVSYTNLNLNYNIIENNQTKSISLQPSINKIFLNNLIPGSTLNIVVNTINNNDIIGISSTFQAQTLLDPVKNLTKLPAEDSYTISVTIVPPLGNYDYVDLFLFDNDENSYSGSSGYGYNVITVSNLYSGLNYTGIFFTNKKNFYAADSDYFTFKTTLAAGSLQYAIETISNVLSLSWNEPYNCLYDSLKFTLTLGKTTYLNYVIDKSLISNDQINRCKIGYNFTYSIADSEETSRNISNYLCPMSNYVIKMDTIQAGFDTVSTYMPFNSKYPNVDCSLVDSQTIGNTTTISWPQPNIYVDYFQIQVIDSALGNQIVYSNNLTNSTLSVKIFNLKFNYNYNFQIKVQFNEKTLQKEKRISGVCVASILTGPPCPIYSSDNNINLLTAPYLNNVKVNMPQNIFSSLSMLSYILVYVGVNNDCALNLNKNCYTALNISINDFTNTESYVLNLSTDITCSNINSLCNIRFVYDKNYFVFVKGFGLCGEVSSDSLIVNVPSPFPLGSAIGIILGVSFGIIFVAFIIIFVLAYRHIKKKYEDESKKLIDVNLSDSSL